MGSFQRSTAEADFLQIQCTCEGKPAADILPDVSDLKSVEGLSRAIDLEKPLFCHGEFTIDNK